MNKKSMFTYCFCLFLLIFLFIDYSGYEINMPNRINLAKIENKNKEPEIEKIEDPIDTISEIDFLASDSALEDRINKELGQRVNTNFSDLFDNTTVKQNVLLDVPLTNQNPELPNGSEVTSLSQMLNFAGIGVDKITLSNKIDKDLYNLVLAEDEKTILSWGNPDMGFVGSMTDTDVTKGLTVNPAPVIKLSQLYLGSTIDLSNISFLDLEKQLSLGFPVMVWVTKDFEVPEFAQWISPSGQTVESTYQTKVILLVGYDDNNMYFNDCEYNIKDSSIDKETFISIWKQMGSKAISYN